MRNSLETRLGIFVALVLIASLIVVDLVGGMSFFKGGYHVSAQFNNIQDLKLGDAVKMSGVTIGRVDKVQLTDGKVQVTMRLNKGVVVKTDSTAAIRFTGLMGQNYVAVDFGSATAPVATDGATLTGVEQADLNALMTKLDNAAAGVENLTKSFTGDKIDNLLGPITDFLKQNTQPLSETISNVNHITAQIKSGQGTVGKLIYSDELYTSALATVTNMQDAAAQIKSTIADAQTIIADAKAGKGTLGKLITDDTLYNETTGTMTNLHQVMLKINNGQGTIGKLINDQEFYKNAKLSLQKLDKATEGLEDQGPLSVLGTAANSLF
jgi:phospholipid/cholesterol/gamma-HCH transport system substrate-binding protein